MSLALLRLLAACVQIDPGSIGDNPYYGTIVIVANSPLDIYERPDSASSRWSSIPAGESLEIFATTADGWLGFDPGVAQAGNSGSFRYRWVPPGGAYTITSGDPALLETVWGPSAGYTYAMTFEPVPVYLEPDSTSEVVDTMPGCSAAAITCRIPGWYKIDPVGGPHPGTAPGWISEAAVSINGAIEDVPLWFDD